jgi:hypothetical protein
MALRGEGDSPPVYHSFCSPYLHVWRDRADLGLLREPNEGHKLFN